MHKNRSRNMKRNMIMTLILLVAYLVLGALLPFARYQKVSAQFAQAFSASDFFGDQVSVDRATIIEDNVTALDLRIRMINEANSQILLSTFDMRQGESTMDLGAALLQAADRGVSVFIMVDGISGMLRMERNSFFDALSGYPGIEIRLYNRPNVLKPWTFNGRMHDKYLIVDDKCFLLGGRNSFDYFLGEYETNSRSYDREILIYNTAHNTAESPQSALTQLQAYFDQVWNLPYTRPLYKEDGLRQEKQANNQIEAMGKRFKELKRDHPELFEPTVSYEEMTVPVNKVTLVSNPVHNRAKEPLVFYQLTELFQLAQERVAIHTPYVVMNRDMCDTLSQISLRVPDFSMVINSVDNGDNFVASSDYLLHKPDIIETGVTLYEFDGMDSTHGKSMVMDSRISVVGSYNLDLRSTYVNTELMLVVDSQPLNAMLNQHMDVFLRDTRKVTGPDTYEIPSHLQVEESSFLKKLLLRVVGPVLQLVRFLL